MADGGGIDSDGDDGASYDADAAPPDPRLWFLRDPGELARRLVLAEILGAPRGQRRATGHARPGPVKGERG